MRSGGNNFSYFPENQLAKFSASETTGPVGHRPPGGLTSQLMLLLLLLPVVPMMPNRLE